MKAVTILPMHPDSGRLDEVPEPPVEDGPILVRALALGVCGTDLEIVGGHYGEAPPGRERLVLGHESLGRVLEAPDGSGFRAGDLVAGIVRRPDPVPCPSCAVDEWDMCRNGQFTEHGIKGLDGFGSERFRLSPKFAVKLPSDLGELGVLVEPTSVVAKAWEHVGRIGSRAAAWTPRRALITGAGPIGLLAALMGVQWGLEVHVLDRVTDGPKPGLVRDLGATYHVDGLEALSEHSDVVLECTGVGTLILDVLTHARPDQVLCLLGVSSGTGHGSFDPDGLSRAMVVGNGVVFGSVNANRRHYEAAVGALERADRGWLARLISRRVPLDRWHEALARQHDDVKPIITFPDEPS